MDLNMDTYCENYQEALNFSGFLPMGLMCPCHEKLPTTFTSQPLKSLWHLGAWPQCGSWSRRARAPMPPLTSCNWEARAMQCWMGRHLHSMATCLSVGTSSDLTTGDLPPNSGCSPTNKQCHSTSRICNGPKSPTPVCSQQPRCGAVFLHKAAR